MHVKEIPADAHMAGNATHLRTRTSAQERQKPSVLDPAQLCQASRSAVSWAPLFKLIILKAGSPSPKLLGKILKEPLCLV